MKLHILGCGDAFGSGGRNQSAYLIDDPDRLFLLDCGATSLLAMKKLGFDSGRLDVILLSHLWLGLWEQKKRLIICLTLCTARLVSPKLLQLPASTF
jgi:hypothetical protein